MVETRFVGIDCGGTHCRIALVTPEGRSSFVGRGANFTTSPQDCALAIADAAEALSDKAHIPLEEICAAPAYIGVAGILDAADATALRQALPFQNAIVEDDRRALVIGALGARDGFVASLGTGAFFARRAGPSVVSLGGWGLNLGDQASGAWLGRSLLSRVMQAHDGLISHSPLTSAILDEFGGPIAIVDFARDALPHEYARLAPGLCAAAKVGDPNGRAIMHEAVDWVQRSLRALGWRPGARVCLPGQLGADFIPFLPEDTAKSVTAPMGEALDGALTLARLEHA